MTNKEVLACGIGAGIAILIGEILSGCAGQYVPPLAVSGSFFPGTSVTVSEPGFTVPAKVVTSPAIAKPTLMLPLASPLPGPDAVIQTGAGQKSTVPVIKAPEVTQPILAVP